MGIIEYQENESTSFAEAKRPYGTPVSTRELRMNLVEKISKLLKAEAEVLISAKGGSMSPFIRKGDQLRICPLRRPRAGDVAVLALPNGQVRIHRIIWMRGKLIGTKGDRLPCQDPPAEVRQLLGVVDLVRRGRRAFRLSGAQGFAIKAAAVFFSLLIAPFVLPTIDRLRGKGARESA